MNKILKSEHVFIAGMTGTGKTFLAKNYLASFASKKDKHIVAILDSKGDAQIDIANDINPYPQVNPKDLTVIFSIDDLEYVDTMFVIYSPKREEASEHFYDRFLEWCYQRGNVTVLVDEAMQVSLNPHHIPEGYKGILTRGRTRNVAVWSCTQRPAGLSQTILSQSTHMFVFNLRLKVDRKRIVEVTGAPEFINNPKDHNFWYWKDGFEEARKARLVL